MSALTMSPSVRQVQRLLDAPGALHTRFQPLVDIRAGRIVGYEALSRFTADATYGPLGWFTAARRAGLGVALETKACIIALQAVPRIPAGQFLSVNLSPEALMSDEVRSRLDAVDPERVLLELTEEADTPDVLRQTDHIEELRRRGVRLAIDDIGTGYSSLARVLQLSPDFLKIDGELVKGCATDPMRFLMLEMFANLADQQGGEVVAEGIEDLDDLRAVQQLGIRYVQGYLFGRPSPYPARLTNEDHRHLDGMNGPHALIDLTAVERSAAFPSAR